MNHTIERTKRRRMRSREAAEYLGLTEYTLARFRRESGGPPFIKIGERGVVYDTADLDAWLEKNKIEK